MSALGKLLKELFRRFHNFINPGYVLTLLANDVDQAAFDKIKELISGQGFIFVVERANIQRNAVVAEYQKIRNNVIWLSIIYSKSAYPERHTDLRITIENRHKGNEPVMQSEIAELGDILHRELSRYVGKDKLRMDGHVASRFEE